MYQKIDVILVGLIQSHQHIKFWSKSQLEKFKISNKYEKIYIASQASDDPIYQEGKCLTSVLGSTGYLQKRLPVACYLLQ